jgi:hypothetical protein
MQRIRFADASSDFNKDGIMGDKLQKDEKTFFKKSIFEVGAAQVTSE